jgi:hypothetical protein
MSVFTILPASRRTRSAALFAASLSIFSVAVFAQASPCRWIDNTCAASGVNLTLPTAGIYTLGTLTTVWCLFTGIANFKTRNDPGGTVTMEVTREGKTETVEVDRAELDGLGGIGFLGSTPDGEVATQTNPDSQPGAGGGTTSDGGASTERISSPLDEAAGNTASTTNGATSTDSAVTTDETTGVDRIGPGSPRQSRDDQGADTSVDRYCGSCVDFKYVRTDTGIRPYCAHHDELMDDMDACDEWEPR